jgi:hypothetical protein
MLHRKEKEQRKEECADGKYEAKKTKNGDVYEIVAFIK